MTVSFGGGAFGYSHKAILCAVVFTHYMQLLTFARGRLCFRESLVLGRTVD
jgi:hypothetical protein